MFQGQLYQTVASLTHSGTPVTGILASALTIKYWRQGDSTLTSVPLTTTGFVWLELGSGAYALTIPASVMTVTGGYYFSLTSTGSDFFSKSFDISPAPLAFSANPALCIVTGNLVDLNGAVTYGQEIVFRVLSVPTKVGNSLITANRLVTVADAQGNFTFSVIQGSTVYVEIVQAGISQQITIPMTTSAQLINLLPSF